MQPYEPGKMTNENMRRRMSDWKKSFANAAKAVSVLIKEAGEESDNKETIQGEKPVEYWDIYDKNKQLTGRTMVRNDWCLKDDEYHLTVLGAVRNTEGKYLITKRVMTKHWAPGWWEVSGGGVQAGETSIQAAVRECSEETGLEIKLEECEFMLSYHRENPGKGDNYFVDVYRITKDFSEAGVHIQEEEADGFMLATPEEIKAFADQGIFLHYDSICKIFE